MLDTISLVEQHADAGADEERLETAVPAQQHVWLYPEKREKYAGSVGYSDTLGTREKCPSIQLSL